MLSGFLNILTTPVLHSRKFFDGKCRHENDRRAMAFSNQPVPKIQLRSCGHLHVGNQAGRSMDPAGSKVLIGRRKCFDGMPQ